MYLCNIKMKQEERLAANKTAKKQRKSHLTKHLQTQHQGLQKHLQKQQQH